MNASYFHYYATMTAITMLLKFQEYLLLSGVLTNAIASEIFFQLRKCK